jgi:pimeloyl-ACP methyl ester carboxylesterase
MFIDHAGAQIFAVSFGAGPRTLLALGGWVGSWELWLEPFTELSQSWRTVAYDHRGTGATLAPVESITMPAMIEDVTAVMDALGIDKCVLAAESAGAAVALQVALAHPQRIEGLVLVSGMYARPGPAGPDPFVDGLRANYLATLGYFVDTCVPEPDGAAQRSWGLQIVSRASQAAAIRLYECMYGVDLRPQVGQITQPTLIIHGTADAIVPPQASEWLAAQIPHSRLEMLPGAGHVPTVTRPHVVADAIDRFFAALI